MSLLASLTRWLSSRRIQKGERIPSGISFGCDRMLGLQSEHRRLRLYLRTARTLCSLQLLPRLRWERGTLSRQEAQWWINYARFKATRPDHTQAIAAWNAVVDYHLSACGPPPPHPLGAWLQWENGAFRWVHPWGTEPESEPPTTVCAACEVIFPAMDAYTSQRDGRLICEGCFTAAQAAGRAKLRQ